MSENQLDSAVALRRVARAAGAALAVAAACKTIPVPKDPGPLVVRAPKLPLTELAPPPSRPADRAKAGMLERINADRAQAGVAPVAWDEAASRVADAFCAAQIAEGTTGHFLTDGMPPYARTAFAGIFGMGAENAVAWHTTAPEFDETPLALALASQRDMMREKPPNDGHRKAILDPDATHVGVGYAVERGSFRMAEEFLTRRLAELRLEADRGTLLVRGRTLPDYTLRFVTIAHEPSPRKLTKQAARERGSYTYPEPSLAFVPAGRKGLRVVGAETDDRIQTGATGDFLYRFAPTQPGLWTMIFYAGEGREKPRPGGLAVVWMEKASAK